MTSAGRFGEILINGFSGGILIAIGIHIERRWSKPTVRIHYDCDGDITNLVKQFDDEVFKQQIRKWTPAQREMIRDVLKI